MPSPWIQIIFLDAMLRHCERENKTMMKYNILFQLHTPSPWNLTLSVFVFNPIKSLIVLKFEEEKTSIHHWVIRIPNVISKVAFQNFLSTCQVFVTIVCHVNPRIPGFSYLLVTMLRAVSSVIKASFETFIPACMWPGLSHLWGLSKVLPPIESLQDFPEPWQTLTFQWWKFCLIWIDSTYRILSLDITYLNHSWSHDHVTLLCDNNSVLH